eukprot:m.496228 g.496228  ORF g.496228 m.496228 type:complete len:101 (-) comp46881_c0_seq1:379-681(-)
MVTSQKSRNARRPADGFEIDERNYLHLFMSDLASPSAPFESLYGTNDSARRKLADQLQRHLVRAVRTAGYHVIERDEAWRALTVPQGHRAAKTRTLPAQP